MQPLAQRRPGGGQHWPAVQDALAKIILDSGLFAALRSGDLNEIAIRLALARDVTDALREINVDGLSHYRHTVQAKHFQHARAVLPVSMGVAAESLGTEALMEDLWVRAPLRYRPAAEFWQTYLDTTVGYLSNLAPEIRLPWLPDLVRYEAMRSACGGVGPTGGRSGAAVSAQMPVPPLPSAGDLDIVSLASGVGVASFQWDVIDIYNDLLTGADFRQVAAREFAVLLAVSSSGWPAVRTFRLAPGMFAVLRKCSRPVCVADLIEGACTGGPAAESVANSVRKAVAGALDCGLLTREVPRA